MKMPEGLDRYFISMEKGCSSNSYVLMVRWGEKDKVWSRLKEKCEEMEGIGGIFYRYKFSGARLTFYVKTGKLMVEPNDEEIGRLLTEIFGGG